jgi:hypothetical protein
LRNAQNDILSYIVKTCTTCSFTHLLLQSTKCNSFQNPMSYKSSLALSLSLVFLGMSNNAPHESLLRFFQLYNSCYPREHSYTFINCFNISSSLNCLGGSLRYCLPLKYFLLRHGWSIGLNLRWPSHILLSRRGKQLVSTLYVGHARYVLVLYPNK